jgi:hypothetical protein
MDGRFRHAAREDAGRANPEPSRVGNARSGDGWISYDILRRVNNRGSQFEVLRWAPGSLLTWTLSSGAYSSSLHGSVVKHGSEK